MPDIFTINNKVQAALEKKFQEHRIIFWYDDKAELTADNIEVIPVWKIKNLLAFLLIFLCFESSFGSISICSWNLQNFGNSKSNLEIDFIVSTIQNYDVIAVQEVIAANSQFSCQTKSKTTGDRNHSFLQKLFNNRQSPKDFGSCSNIFDF